MHHFIFKERGAVELIDFFPAEGPDTEIEQNVY